MCHKLAHVILEHSFAVTFAANERKCGLGGAEEEEADWLAGEILIPYDGAPRLARANVTDQQAAAAFNVSLAVARWRMNHREARRVAERIRSKAMSS